MILQNSRSPFQVVGLIVTPFTSGSLLGSGLASLFNNNGDVLGGSNPLQISKNSWSSIFHN
jgi:hypothetical protein